MVFGGSVGLRSTSMKCMLRDEPTGRDSVDLLRRNRDNLQRFLKSQTPRCSAASALELTL